MTRKSGRSCLAATNTTTTSPRSTITKKGSSVSPNKRGTATTKNSVVTSATTNGDDDEEHMHESVKMMTKVTKMNGLMSSAESVYNNENSPSKEGGHHHLRSKITSSRNHRESVDDGGDEKMNTTNHVGSTKSSFLNVIGEKRHSLSSPPQTPSVTTIVPTTPSSPLYKVIDKSMSYTKTTPPSTNSVSHYNHRSPPLSPVDTKSISVVRSPPIQKVQVSSSPNIRRRYKRPRQNELLLLNTEAENFMFPKVKEEQLNYDSDASDIILIVNGKRQKWTGNKSTINGLVKEENDVEKTMVRIKVELGGMERRGGGIRGGGGSNETVLPLKKRKISGKPKKSYCATRVSQRRQKVVDADEEQQKVDEKAKEKLVKLEPGKVVELEEEYFSNLTRIIQKETVTSCRFAFERVPSTEPWFAAFHRQDVGEERVFEYYGSTNYKKLPYELGPLPPLPSDCCHLSHLISQTTPSKSRRTPAVAPPPPEPPPTKPKVVSSPRLSKLKRQQQQQQQLETSIGEKLASVSKAMMDRKKKLLLDLEQPRKSPREHASTLAILSCLLQQQKKKDSEGEMSSSHNSETMSERRDSHYSDSVEMIIGGNDDAEEQVEEATASSSNKPQVAKTKRKSSSSSRSGRKKVKKGLDWINLKELNREIDSLLSDPLNDSAESIDLKVLDKSDEFLVPFRELPDLKHLFMSVDQEQPHLKKSFSNKKSIKVTPSNAGRSMLDYHLRNTKKRKNRTGWPTNKRRISAKRDSHKSGGSCCEEAKKEGGSKGRLERIKEEPSEEGEVPAGSPLHIETAGEDETMQSSPILRNLLSPNKNSLTTCSNIIINSVNFEKKKLENGDEDEDYDSISDSISVLVSDDPDNMTSDGVVQSPRPESSTIRTPLQLKQTKLNKYFAKRSLLCGNSSDSPVNGAIADEPMWSAESQCSEDSKSLVLLKDKNGINKLNSKLYEPIISIKRVSTTGESPTSPLASSGVKCGPSSYRLRSARAGRRKRRKKRN